MTTFDADALVHAHGGRWIVAERDGAGYRAPCRRWQAGCQYMVGSLDYVADVAYSYKRRADAVRRARALYAALVLEVEP